jgi:hypothetical protein
MISKYMLIVSYACTRALCLLHCGCGYDVSTVYICNINSHLLIIYFGSFCFDAFQIQHCSPKSSVIHLDRNEIGAQNHNQSRSSGKRNC